MDRIRSFSFYISFLEAIDEIEQGDVRLRLYEAVCKYALRGEEPALEGTAKAMFMLIRPQIDANLRRRENGMQGGRPPRGSWTGAGQTETGAEPNGNRAGDGKQPNDNRNKNENRNDNKNMSPVGDGCVKNGFEPPDVGEVRAYCSENGCAVDAEEFVDFYESKGWMVGKNKMKNWKAALRNWAKRERARPDDRKAFEQREYTQADLERRKREIVADMVRMAEGDYT